jgi:two-component SAPR family response regulator
MIIRRLLVIIDDDENTNRLVESKSKGRFQIANVPDAKRGIELVRSIKPDLIIISRCLPDLDGLDTLRIIREIQPSVPIIFLAMDPDNDLIISAFRLGAKDFFKKPFSSVELVSSIDRHLGRGSDEAGTAFLQKGTWLSYLERVFHNIIPATCKSNQTVPVNHHNVRIVESVNGNDDVAKPTPERPAVQFNFLGRFHMVIDRQTYDYWPGKKGKAILAYLAYYHKQRILRDRLMDLFWSNATTDSARNCLNVALHGIRALVKETGFQDELICFSNECYFINPNIEINSDVEDFLKGWKLAQSVEREKGLVAALGEYEIAAGIYKGDFMEEDLYEDWTTLERENLKEIYLVILDRLSNYFAHDGKPMTAVNLCKTMLEKDNCREDVHRRLMKCYMRLGQRTQALRQFQKCEEILRTELQVEPTQHTLALVEKIKIPNRSIN